MKNNMEKEEENPQKNRIIQKLKEKGGRITKQRLLLLDIILASQYFSCKEIYCEAAKKDPGIGMATVYRMIAVLEELGVVTRGDLYIVNGIDHLREPDFCTVVLEDHSVCRLNLETWKKVVESGLAASGYCKGQSVVAVTVQSHHWESCV